MKSSIPSALDYYPLVISIAKKVARRVPLELDDIINSGVVGLMEAVNRYDERRDNVFATFAYHNIRGRITDHLRSSDLASRTVRARQNKGEQIAALFQPETSCEPKISEGRALLSAFQFLDPQEKEVILSYYYHEESQIAIGDRMKISQSRVCQLHKRALKKMRKKLL